MNDVAQMTNVCATKMYASNKKKKLTPSVLWLIILAQIYTTKQILLQIDCDLI
jgi:hypothetical protein